MEKPKFVICLDNDGFLASLEIGKLYQTIPDKEAEKLGGLRVIDEDGEDYFLRCGNVLPAPSSAGSYPNINVSF